MFNTKASAMNSGLISVIIPVYNVEQYLERCLNSLLSQTYKDFEIIIVNDGSTDSSFDIACRFKNIFQNTFSIISISNSGVSAARNIGIKNSVGEYLCFIDSDDMVSPFYLEFLITSLHNHPQCKLAICQKEIVMDGQETSERAYHKLICTTYNHNEILNKMLYHDIAVGIWCTLSTRELVLKNQLYFAEGYKYSEDLEMVWKLAIHSDEIVLLENSLYQYRNRSGSAMKKFDTNRIDGFYLFQKLNEYIQINCPEFSMAFDKHGVSYWVWSTIRQAAILNESYRAFSCNIQKFGAEKYLIKLYDYPNLLVRLSSRLYLGNAVMYYYIVKFFSTIYK